MLSLLFSGLLLVLVGTLGGSPRGRITTWRFPLVVVAAGFGGTVRVAGRKAVSLQLVFGGIIAVFFCAKRGDWRGPHEQRVATTHAHTPDVVTPPRCSHQQALTLQLGMCDQAIAPVS